MKVRHGDENAYATKTILIAVLIKSAAALWEAQGLLISHLPSLTIYMNMRFESGARWRGPRNPDS